VTPARPAPERIVVSLEALRADAVDWDHAAADLRGATHRAEAVVVSPAVFSFAGGPVAEAYELLRIHTVALLSGGADNLGAIAAALRAAAATYEADELEHVHRLRNVY
jgi:hypothetical protein